MIVHTTILLPRVILLLIVLMCISSTSGAKVTNPLPGSPERRAIMDSLRQPVQKSAKEKPVFHAVELNAENGWAFVTAIPKDTSGKRVLLSGQTVCAVLRKNGSGWRVLEVAYSPPDRVYQAAQVLLERHPEAPALIFGFEAATSGYGIFPEVPYHGVKISALEKRNLLNIDSTFHWFAWEHFHRGTRFADKKLIDLGSAVVAKGMPAVSIPGKFYAGVRVSASAVDRCVAKYLTQKIGKHQGGSIAWDPISRMYTVSEGDGVEADVTTLASLKRNGDGTYRAVIATIDVTSGKPDTWQHLIVRRVPGKTGAFQALEWAPGK